MGDPSERTRPQRARFGPDKGLALPIPVRRDGPLTGVGR